MPFQHRPVATELDSVCIFHTLCVWRKLVSAFWVESFFRQCVANRSQLARSWWWRERAKASKHTNASVNVCERARGSTSSAWYSICQCHWWKIIDRILTKRDHAGVFHRCGTVCSSLSASVDVLCAALFHVWCACKMLKWISNNNIEMLGAFIWKLFETKSELSILGRYENGTGDRKKGKKSTRDE